MPTYTQSFTVNPTVRVTSAYGELDPWGAVHKGLDTVLSPDTGAHAPASGVVRVANHDGSGSGYDSWGNCIVVEMDNGSRWLAGHFANQIWSVGDIVEQGQYIGTQGATGDVTGPHVHWELWLGPTRASVTDPSGLLGIPNAVGSYTVAWDPAHPPGPGPGPGYNLPVWLLFKFRRCINGGTI